MAKDTNPVSVPVKRKDNDKQQAGLGTAIEEFMKHRAALVDNFIDTRFPEFSRRWQALSKMRDWTPAIDVSTGDKEIIVKADLPGVKKEDIKVSVDGGFLTISGERKEEKETKEKNYYFSERSEGSFYRSIRVPDGADADSIQASYKDGVLTVTVPTPKAENAKKVNVAVK